MADKTLDELRVELAGLKEAMAFLASCGPLTRKDVIWPAVAEAQKNCERRIDERMQWLHKQSDGARKMNTGAWTDHATALKAELDRHRKALADSPGGPA